LPGTVKTRLDDVRLFHQSVVENRRSYLEMELDAAQERIARRGQDMESLDRRRAEVMAILQSSGALEQYTKLQAEVSRADAKVATLTEKFKIAQQLEGDKTELELARTRLLQRLRLDHREQAATVKKAVLAFNEVSQALYEEPGTLSIEATENGPKFEANIQAENSKGVGNMLIFCFDMMLMKLCVERSIGPGFLVHDSHLFDGVDNRQINQALKVGAKMSADLNFQYIVTMNSDVLPNDWTASEHILPVQLTDAKEDGGLFGIRF